MNKKKVGIYMRETKRFGDLIRVNCDDCANFVPKLRQHLKSI